MTSTPTTSTAISPTTLTIAAVGDTHCTRRSEGALQPMLEALAGRADLLILCGDLTDNGHPDEARILARELARGVSMPMLAVLGNHDFQSGQDEEVVRVLGDAGVRVLDEIGRASCRERV